MSWAEASSSRRPDSVPADQGPATSARRRRLQNHWRRVAKALPRGGSLLEVGAGSCMVSKWMVGVRSDLRVVAADCGSYPLDAGELGTIRFLAQTWLETLPFGDGEFDAVVSQFAFEYADRARALRECSRVLGKQGVLSFVMHAAGGALHGGCALRVAGAQIILEDPPLPELLRKAGAIANLKSRSTMFDLSIRARLLDRRSRLEQLEAAAGIRLPGLHGYLDAVVVMIGRPDFAEWVETATERLNEDLFMGSDQLRAALSEADVDEISTLAADLGLRVAKVERREFYWLWSATRLQSRSSPHPRGVERIKKKRRAHA